MRATLERGDLVVVPLALALGAATVYLPIRPVALAAVAAVAAVVMIRLAGARVAALGLALAAIPPGVIGESSSRLSLAALLAAFALVVATVPEVEADAAVVALLGACGVAFLMVGHTAHRHSFTTVALIYFAVAAVAWQISQRPTLAQRVLRFFTLVVAAECASYWISYLIGFRGGPHIYHLKTRHVDVYPPFTLTSGSGGFWGSHPRLIVFSGEGGLGAVALLVALAYVLKNETGRKRTLLAALLVSGIVAGQSSGAVLALGVLAIVAAAVSMTRTFTLLPAAIAAGVAVLALSRFATDLLHAKLHDNIASLADRGLLTPGSFAGDISLHATLSHHAAVAVPVIALLGYLAVRTFRDPVGLGLVAAVAVIAWYAQPLQDHPGVWLLLLLAVGLQLRDPDRREGRLHRPGEPELHEVDVSATVR
jgi:hypothetical protein